MDAIVVSFDVLVRESERYPKGCNLQLMLFTDAASAFNADGVEDIVQGLRSRDVQVDVIISGDEGAGTAQQQEGAIFLEKLCADVDEGATGICNRQGTFYRFEAANKAISSFKKQGVRPTTVFRGTLDMADVKIPVWGFIRQTAAKKISFKKLSALVEYDSAQESSGSIDRKVSHHLQDENETEVEKEMLVKGELIDILQTRMQ